MISKNLFKNHHQKVIILIDEYDVPLENAMIRALVEQADFTVKQELEALIAGETIEKPVHEDITYEDVYKTQDNLWNFLFFTGYLKCIQERLEEETIFLTMAIPNMEIRYICDILSPLNYV